MCGRGGWNAKGLATTAEARTLDVNGLRRAGALEPGWRGGWQWTRDGERIADVRVESEDGAVTLVYRWRRGEGPWQDVRERVAVSWAPCRFGGQRPFLHCPRCDRRAVKLYTIGARFLCRACNRLVYPSQRERALDRTLRRANRIRMKLGGEAGMLNPFPMKPKGMHRQTYERLHGEVEAAERLADGLLMERYEWIVGRFEHLVEPARSRAPRREFWAS